MTVTNQKQYADLSKDFDVEEMAMMQECLIKIRKHVERNLESATDQDQVSRLMDFQWHLNANFQ